MRFLTFFILVANVFYIYVLGLAYGPPGRWLRTIGVVCGPQVENLWHNSEQRETPNKEPLR